ncbi:MAG: BatD family protein [Elusimicrobiales bacterium]
MALLRAAAKRNFLCAALFLMAAAPCCAQLTINASVDKDEVPLDEALILTVTISGASSDVGEPQLPSLPNFNVFSSGQSQNIMIINGHISTSVKYQFSLAPRFVGAAVIGPVSLHYNGADYATREIQVRVLPPGAARQSAPQSAPRQYARPAPARPQQQQRRRAADERDVFVVANADKTSAYVNEQVTLTVRFYTAVPLMGNPDYTAPPAKGFLTEDMPPMRNGNENLNGREYMFTEVKTALFGATAGQTEIAPAAVRYQVRQNMDMDPFDPNFFQNFFSGATGGGPQQEARTAPIHINLKPLPQAGRPANFGGAVGNFKITSSIDRRELKAGEAANLSVTIEGTGNLKAITAPALPDMPSMKVYDMVSSLNIKKDGDVVHGSKTFKAVVIPRVSGKAAVPAIHFSYFNPASGGYATVSSLPIPLNVLAADNQSAQQVSFTGSQPGGEVTAISEDIHYISQAGDLSAPSRALCALAGAGLWNLAGPVLMLFGFAFAKWRAAANSDTALSRKRKAYSAARTRIKEAEKLFAQNRMEQAMTMLSGALADYLSDKLATPTGGLTLRKITELSRYAYPGIRNETVSALSEVWQELDMLRFAPTAHSSHNGDKPVSVKTLELVEMLEKDMSK